MSYGTKYRLSYTDNFSQAVIVDLKKDGYSGAVATLIGTGQPLTITHDNSSDFLFEPILGTWVTLRIIVRTVFGYSDLFTSDPREWQMTASIAGANYFTGYLMPFYFNHEYKGVPYTLEIIASDQLGTLKNIIYPNVITKYSSATPLTIISKILYYTGLNINLREGINVFEDSMTSGAAYTPLNQCYVPLTSYQDADGNNFDLYTVLKNELLRFQAVIRQVEGEWHIWRPSEAIATYNRRLYQRVPAITGDYAYVSTEAHDPTVATTASGVSRATLCRTLNYGTLSLMESWRDYNLIQHYRPMSSMLENPDFIDWVDSSHPEGWSQIGVTISEYTDHRCHIAGVAAHTFLTSIYQTLTDTIIKSNYQKFNFKIKFASFINAGDSGLFKACIQVLSGGTYYYHDFGNFTWSVSVNYFELDLPEGESEYDLNLLTPHTADLPSDITEVNLYIFAPQCSDAPVGHIVIDYASLQLKYGTDSYYSQDYPENNNEIVPVNADNNLEGETIELFSADMPDNMPVPIVATILNHKFIFNCGLFLDSAMQTITDLWNDSGSTAGLTLVEILKSLIGKQYGASAEMISVNIMTKLLSGDDTVQLTEHSNKKYFPRRIEWDQKAGILRYEMIEIICTSGFLLQETGDYLLQETGDKIII